MDSEDLVLSPSIVGSSDPSSPSFVSWTRD